MARQVHGQALARILERDASMIGTQLKLLADRDAYLQAEAAARQVQLGLWRDGDAAVPPWQWRKAVKEAQAPPPPGEE